jgi:uroporphyrinogen III methyltransferase/synthase
MNLTGKRIVITRPRAQAEEFAHALIAEAAQPIFFPVIEIAPLDNYSVLDSALLKLEQYDWVIFTSIHGVDSFFKRLEFLDINHVPAGLRIAAIGPKTALCLSMHGVAADFVPNEYTAEVILPGLGEDVSGERFLLPQSDLAREFLAKEIRSAGGLVDEVVAYHTRTAHPDPSAVETLRSGVDVITFASPSSVKSFMNVLVECGLDASDFPGNPLIACIGPVTASAVREAGLPVHVEAKEHTISGLINALKKM